MLRVCLRRGRYDRQHCWSCAARARVHRGCRDISLARPAASVVCDASLAITLGRILMQYKIGQAVWALRRVTNSWVAATVISELQLVKLRGCGHCYAYDLDVPDEPLPAGCIRHASIPDRLRPRNDDDRQLVSWDDCVWQPSKVQA